jgi:hypothetical protein
VQQRPIGVIIVGALMIIGGALMIIGWAMLLHKSLIGQSIFYMVIVIFMTAIGIANMAMGYGLVKGMTRAWDADVTLSSIGMIIALILIIMGFIGNVVGLIIDVIVLFYLYRPHVMMYFGKNMSTTSSK